MKTDELEEFDKEFELHDLGKDEFTLCHNNGDDTCDGGISIYKDQEPAARRHLEKVKAFIAKNYISRKEDAEKKKQMIEENAKRYFTDNSNTLENKILIEVAKAYADGIWGIDYIRKHTERILSIITSKD